MAGLISKASFIISLNNERIMENTTIPTEQVKSSRIFNDEITAKILFYILPNIHKSYYIADIVKDQKIPLTESLHRLDRLIKEDLISMNFSKTTIKVNPDNPLVLLLQQYHITAEPTKDHGSFVIPLDTFLDMVAAYNQGMQDAAAATTIEATK